jgi:hypothetical protein
MKKYFLSFVFLFISINSFAQDNNSKAYNTGYQIGRLLGVAIVAGLFIWGISRLVKKMK